MVLWKDWSRMNVGRLRMLLLGVSLVFMLAGCGDGGGGGGGGY